MVSFYFIFLHFLLMVGKCRKGALTTLVPHNVPSICIRWQNWLKEQGAGHARKIMHAGYVPQKTMFQIVLRSIRNNVCWAW